MSSEAVERVAAYAKVLREGQAPHQQSLAAALEALVELARAGMTPARPMPAPPVEDVSASHRISVLAEDNMRLGAENARLNEQLFALTQGSGGDKGAGGGAAALQEGGARPMTASELEANYTVAELRDLADREKIDLTGLTIKADIAHAIAKARSHDPAA